MADRKDYFFRQKVTEAELDAGFDGLEQADFNLAVDHGLIGIVEGMVVTENSGTPDLTVDVSGPGQSYSKQGERIAFSSGQNQDLSVDDGAVSTAVAAPGNARIVSLFITFDRLLSDPRIDGNSLTVFHLRDESFAFSVVAGAEATSGTEVPPALDPNKILLADVTLLFGTTQIFNADIDTSTTTRREDAYAFPSATPVALTEGTTNAAVSALLTALNNHLAAIANKHPAADVTYAGSPNWESGNPLTGPPTDVEAAIDAVVSDLARLTGGIGSGAEQIGIDALPNFLDGAAQPATDIFGRLTAIINAYNATGGNGGADKIGVAAGAAQWADASGLTLGSIFDQLQEIVTDLGNVAGAGRIGNVAQGNVSAVTVQDAIDELDIEKAGLALANIFTAVQTLTGGALSLVFSGANLANGVVPTNNALYSKNLVKSWVKAAGAVKDEEFGHTAAVTASSGAMILDFDADTANAFDQVNAGLGDGATATTAIFLTADTHAINGVTIFAWRWDGAAIVAEDLAVNDWGIIRVATI